MSGKIRPSHVQLAMGIDGARGRGSLRFSFSKLNTMEDSQRAAAIVQNAVEQLRTANQSGVSIGLRPTQCSLSYESND
jgi:cysteine desulfurase